jgi:hypothetical protein
MVDAVLVLPNDRKIVYDEREANRAAAVPEDRWLAWYLRISIALQVLK